MTKSEIKVLKHVEKYGQMTVFYGEGMVRMLTAAKKLVESGVLRVRKTYVQEMGRYRGTGKQIYYQPCYTTCHDVIVNDQRFSNPEEFKKTLAEALKG
jgi:hypothetical protein